MEVLDYWQKFTTRVTTRVMLWHYAPVVGARYHYYYMSLVVHLSLYLFCLCSACLSSGPNDKLVNHRIYESGSGEFTVEYLPAVTGTQNQLTVAKRQQ